MEKKNRLSAKEAKALREKGLRRCPRCEETKVLGEFYTSKHSNGGYGTYCKDCANEYWCSHREWYLDSYKRNRRKARDRALRRKFGIGIDDYERMMSEQNGKCAICELSEKENGKGLAVDHCHRTGQVRKLLCNNCNVIVGFLGENPDLAVKIIAYMKEWDCNGVHAHSKSL